jgi:uncharacterized protein (TIGR02284 family)
MGYQFTELSTSGYMLAPGFADITGWPVINPDGSPVGDVSELLFDPEAGQVRYLVINLTGTSDRKRVAVPIGLAERHAIDNAVVLPEVTALHIEQWPAFTTAGEFSPEHELDIRRTLEGHSTAPYEHPQFLEHAHFNEDRFYPATDLSAEAEEVTEARAERARRIVERLDPSTNNQENLPYQKTMEITEDALDVLNDLILINNDRVAGFEKAGHDLEEQDSGLRAIFNKLAAESEQNVTELKQIIQQYGATPAEGSSTKGALHRAWLDVKAVFTGGDLEAILNECETGEDAIKAAYRTALNEENQLSPELVSLLQRQQIAIKDGHDLIKSLRDQVRTDNDDETPDTEVYLENETAESIAPEPSFEGAAGEYDSQLNTSLPEPAQNAPEKEFDSEPDTYIPEPESIEQEEEWEEQVTATGQSKLMEFFINELQDLLWAERELVETLPDLAEAATSSELKTAFMSHLAETEVHVRRLEQIFAILGLEPESRKCEAMSGILDEGDEIISATEEGTAQRDVGLIFAGQKAEHYEIASYGGMIALAKTLGYYEVAEILVLTLEEEKSADAKLTEIAETQANYEASTERADD